MRYSEEIIEEVRSRNNIVDVVSEYVRLQKKGSSYFGLCPFHNEKSPSFSVSPGKQMYYCFGCGVGGNVMTFLMEYEHATFPEAVEKLADRAGITLPKAEYTREDRERDDLRTRLLAVNKLAAGFYYYQLRGEKGQQAMAYLRGRQLSDDTMKRFGLGLSGRSGNELYRYLKSKDFSDELLAKSGLFNMDERRGMSDKFWNRVIFPIMDERNRVIGFGGRVMGDAKPKYLNSPETLLFDKSRNLYGLHLARTSRRRNMIVCEGYMDVISLHQAGFTNAVASLGTALTSQQCSLIKRFTNEVLVVYDNDEAGVKAARRGIPLLRAAGLSTKVVDLSPFKDPDEFIKNRGKEAFEERLDGAMNGFLYEISRLRLEYDMSDPQGKTDFFHETARQLCSFTDEMERINYIEAICSQFGLDEGILKKEVSRQALRGVGIEQKETRQEVPDKKKKRADGTDMAQRLMLTWLSVYPSIWKDIRRLITLEDFTDPMYRHIAELLYEQYDKGNLNPAAILNHFEDVDEQKRAAAVLNARIQVEREEERQQALRDVILKMKEESLRQRSQENPSDVSQLMKLMQEKKELESFRRNVGDLKVSFS